MLAAIKLAQKEIDKTGLPHPIHFNISLKKGEELAQKLQADTRLVKVGVTLMDLKLGEAFRAGKLEDHVHMSADAAKKFLKDYTLTDKEKDTIINCIEAHHGAVAHTSLESEIATNADCYRFIHPTGVTQFIATLGTRTSDLRSIIEQAEAKLDEKWRLVSLPIVKKELGTYYKQYKALLRSARKLL